MNPKISIAIPILGHADRFEWLVEKAVEFQIHQIFPFKSQKTKYVPFKKSRCEYIIAHSSSKYKTQPPTIHNLCSLDHLFNLNTIPNTRLLAHYSQDNKDMLIKSNEDCILIIGPEDGFLEDEIKLCIKNNCKLVTLGDFKLRTEAAGMAGICILNGIWETIPSSVLSH